jgi:hypothetical protein
LGPRFFGAMWWLFQPVQWQLAFNGVFGIGRKRIPNYQGY